MHVNRLIGLIVLLIAVLPLSAHGKPRRRHRTNMPAGWQWPPTAQMKQDGERCLDELRTRGVSWRAGKATRTVATPVVVQDMTFGRISLRPIARKPPFVMDCHLALALARYGNVLYQLGVRELRFSSLHDYRRIRRKGYRGKGLSRHALGLAVDIYELVLADGTTLVVKRDYRDSELLHRIEAAINAAGGFRTALTPGSDPRSHYDHFHIEARMPLPGALPPAATTPIGQLTPVPPNPQ